MGPNGAGKSTSIDLITGLTEPDQGSVQLFGLSPREAVAQGWVSAVMQTGGLLPDLTVAESVELTAACFGVPASSVGPVMDRAGIGPIGDRLVRSCSGGQQQRLRFAMALVNDPRLLILDEPTTGLDVEARRAFWQSIHADAQSGRTVVFATHYLAEADEYADRVVLIKDGRVVADGSSAQVRGAVAGRTVRATLVASPAWVRQVLTDPQINEITVLGDQLTVSCDDSDRVARLLLNQGLAKDLQISDHGLEEAFLRLTGDSADSDPSTGPGAEQGA